MADESEDDWHLCAWEGFDAEKNSQVMAHVRPSSPTEVARFSDAVALLKAFLSHGAYADYIHATEKLHEAIASVEQAWAAGPKGRPPEEAFRNLHAAVKTWLSAVRSFDDRMSAWLSKTLGKGAVYEAFKQELRDEYESNFAYRMSYSLRNASEHAATVLNHIKVDSRESPEGGTIDRVDLGFDATGLVANFPKLKAPIRQELSDYAGTMSLEAVVGHATQTVERAMAASLLAAHVEVGDALQVVEDLHREAVAAGGLAACFMTAVDSGGGKMTMTPVEIEVANTVRDNLEASAHIVGLPRAVTTAVDLAL